MARLVIAVSSGVRRIEGLLALPHYSASRRFNLLRALVSGENWGPPLPLKANGPLFHERLK